MNPLVFVEDVWKSYGKGWVLRGVSLALGEGVSAFIVGPNGSGKTTLLKIIGGLIHPSRGRVLVGGVKPQSREAKRMIGIVHHSPVLYDELTVEENLRYYARLYGIDEYNVKDDEVARLLGVDRYAGVRVGSLSFGWRRRVDVVRALIHRPRLLLVDEPFTGLDEEASEALSNLINSLVEDGVTAILTSPRPGDSSMVRATVRYRLEGGRLLRV